MNVVASPEYTNTLTSASLFDCSKQGKLTVKGKDAPSFLHNLCTNDINNLPLGGGLEAYFCDHRAKALAQAFIYHVLLDGDHAFWLDVTPGFEGKLLAHLDKHLISEAVELADVTSDYVQMHLAGPKARAILEKAIGSEMPDLPEFLHMERSIVSPCNIRRHDPLGFPGYDIVCRKEREQVVRNALLAAGAKEAGQDIWETLRIEAATPVYGTDIKEDRFVMEVARALRAVSYNKGCYLGQEPIVMSRDRTGFVNRSFFGVKVLGTNSLNAGTKLTRDGAEVGLITSSSLSPRLNAPIAIGYLKRGSQDAGLKLQVAGTEEVVEVLPFPPLAGM
jgi:folate-binding protein YgfZ